jgi:Holliday junction DNA helicase RuvA
MIGRLTGTIVSCDPGHVLLDVAGVGYDVQIPLPTFYALSRSADRSEVRLHVHTHVREDALQLFGFVDREERDAFRVLIGIAGVGPRTALAILSGIGAEELRATVHGRDSERLQRIPGIGKKTAERLLLELRDKLAPGPADPTGKGADRTAASAGLETDAVSALVNLGYSRPVARRAVERAATRLGASAALESVLRAALAGLVR